jgi:hypothetical protein
MAHDEGKVIALEQMLARVRRKARTMTRGPELMQDVVPTRPATQSEAPPEGHLPAAEPMAAEPPFEDEGQSTAESRVLDESMGRSSVPSRSNRHLSPPEVVVTEAESEDALTPPNQVWLSTSSSPSPDVGRIVGSVSGSVSLGQLFDEALGLRF